MRLATRKLLDRSFSGMGLLAIAVMGLALVVILVPIFKRGSGAFVFRGTVEFDRVMLDRFNRGDAQAVAARVRRAVAAREPVYAAMDAFEQQMSADRALRREHRQAYRDFEKRLEDLLGPRPGSGTPALVRRQYGATRWDRAAVALERVLFVESWDYSDASAMGKQVMTPRVEAFRGTALEPVFAIIRDHVEDMLQPHRVFYPQFLTDASLDAHIFGGIGPEVLGTVYLTIGAMLFAIPLGVVAAIYFAEYAVEGRLVSALRLCVSTLAGVPSIVFGLFGLAFFINTMHVSHSKSVLAGSLTLGLLILPMVIRASEEAIRSVPRAYKEAALSLGAGRWHTVVSVILPAALPGILTGIVISMGRAAGETAPIIFTAAVSVGRALRPWETLTQPTPALSWNIYNLCTEHEAVDEIRHVQYGMVMTLVLVALLLNAAALIIRGRVARKLKG